MDLLVHLDPVTGEPLGVWFPTGSDDGFGSVYAAGGGDWKTAARAALRGELADAEWDEVVDWLVSAEGGLRFVRLATDEVPAAALERERRSWASTSATTGTSKFDAAARRRRLAIRAPRLVEAILADPQPFEPPYRTPAPHHLLTGPTDERLVVIVAAGEPARQVDEALGTGLALQGDRDLHLVLPDVPRQRADNVPVWAATADRLAWCDTPVWLWVYDAEHQVRAVPTPRRTDVLDRVRQDRPIPLAPHGLGERAAWVDRLIGWADAHPSLVAAHREAYLAWHADGRKVLEIRRTGGVRVVGGVAYTHEHQGPPASAHDLTGPIDDETLDHVQAAVTTAIQRRYDGADDADAEARLQARLHDEPDVLGLVGSVLRELPVSRPAADRAYVDLVGVDSRGDIHLIETKVQRDWMLGLQALDYWIWAQANLELLAATLADTGMPVSPSPAVFLDVVVGTETGTEPGDIRLLLPQLEALTGKMKWRIGDVTGWRLLDEPAKVTWHRRGRAPLHDRRHTPPRFAFSLQNHLIRVATGEGLSEHPPFVAPGDWLLDKAWDDFQALEAAGKKHHMVGHVRSSQVFALNLFAGLNPERRTALARQVDDTIIAADPPVFEFEDDRDTLGEATQTSPHRTQVDVALPCLSGDRERVWILVEVKLTEDGFGSCSAAVSPNNDRRDLCATPEPFGGDPEGCFQLRNQDREHRRRYHHYLGDLNRPATLGHGCPFRDNNQPMRNFALAGVLVDRGDAARVHVVLCAHDDHRMIWRRWDEAVRDTPTTERAHVGSLTASDVLREHPSTDAKLLATRYRIPS